MRSDVRTTDNIGILVLRLLIITVCAGLILGVVYTVTKEPIAEQARLAADESRKTVLPAAVSFEQLDLTGYVSDGDDFGEVSISSADRQRPP